MPPLILIDDDEIQEFIVGDPLPLIVPTPDVPVPVQPVDDRTIFYFRRLRYSEREEFQDLYSERGQFDVTGYNLAVISICLTGWKYLVGNTGDIPWPTGAEPFPLSGALPGEQLNPRKRQIAQVMRIARCLPVEVAHQLARRMLDPSPEQLLKNWSAPLNGSTPSPRLTGTAIPASNVGPSAEGVAKPSPAIPEA